MNCPECGKEMKNLGNVSGIVMTSNPVQWDDTLVCDACKIRVIKRCSGTIYEKPDMSGYRLVKP